MPIQHQNSQSMSAGEYDLKPFIVITYKNQVPYGATAIPGKELRQILQMLQRLSVLHPEQFSLQSLAIGIWEEFSASEDAFAVCQQFCELGRCRSFTHLFSDCDSLRFSSIICRS